MSTQLRKYRARQAILSSATRNGWELKTNQDMGGLWDRLVLVRGDQSIEIYQTQGAGVIREASLTIGGYFARVIASTRESYRLEKVLATLGSPVEVLAQSSRLPSVV